MTIQCDDIAKMAIMSLCGATVVSGFTLLAVGITALGKVDWRLVDMIDPALYPAVGAVLASIGGVVILLGVMAVFGIRLEDRRLLMAVFWTTLVLLVASGIAVVVGFGVGASAALEDIQGRLLVSIRHYNSDSLTHWQWDKLQTGSQCCGVNGPVDWAPLLGFNHVPRSCCISQWPTNQQCTATRGSYNTGCLHQMSDTAETFSAVTGGISAAVAVVMLLMMVTAYALAKDVEQSIRPYATFSSAGST